eukprot:scaffold89413_cov66-Phaeocystis_antarctica.AAC.4
MEDKRGRTPVLHLSTTEVTSARDRPPQLSHSAGHHANRASHALRTRSCSSSTSAFGDATLDTASLAPPSERDRFAVAPPLSTGVALGAAAGSGAVAAMGAAAADKVLCLSSSSSSLLSSTGASLLIPRSGRAVSGRVTGGRATGSSLASRRETEADCCTSEAAMACCSCSCSQLAVIGTAAPACGC